MGLRDNWCTRKGHRAHQKGIRKLESTKRKCLHLLVFLICAVVYSCVGYIYYWRSANAFKIESELPTEGFVWAYDSCMVPTNIPDPEVSYSKREELV